MKRFIKNVVSLMLLSFISVGTLSAQTETEAMAEEVLDNAIVEVQAKYPGGEVALLKHVFENIKYPAIAMEQGVQGRVIVKFLVGKTGKVEDVRILRGLSANGEPGKACDNEAIRVVKTLKAFTPATQNGKPVRVWFTLPISFRLSE